MDQFHNLTVVYVKDFEYFGFGVIEVEGQCSYHAVCDVERMLQTFFHSGIMGLPTKYGTDP